MLKNESYVFLTLLLLNFFKSFFFLVRSQLSVEGGVTKKKLQNYKNEEQRLEQKIKNSMINLFGIYYLEFF